MPIAPVVLQRRYRQLGRLRMGEKGEKGQPVKRDTWRLTSPSKTLLETAAGLWGGEVREWEGSPVQGTEWELATETSEIPVLVPPQDLEGSQWLEQWSGGGLKRRCDGVTEMISGRGCLCDEDNRDCQVTTHLLVMLPQIPDVGVWRLTAHGVNAAVELPGTVQLLDQIRQAGEMPGAFLGIEPRTSKKNGKNRHFIVPVLKLPHSLLELGAATTETGVPSLTIGGPPSPDSNVIALHPAELPGRAELPADPSFARPTLVATPEVPLPAAFDPLADVLAEGPPSAGLPIDMTRERIAELYDLMSSAGHWQDGALDAALKKHTMKATLAELSRSALVQFARLSWEKAHDAIQREEP